MMSRKMSTALFLFTAILLAGLATSPAHAQTIQVTAATPASAIQGTVNLDVVITGNGFKRGAKAQWFVTGSTDPGGVTVNSTTFNSSSKLTANITVSESAVITNFDIQVLNSDGRSGKGTELFAVQKNPSILNVTSVIYDLDATNNLLLARSDDYPNGSGAQNSASYSGADSGVESFIDATFYLRLQNQTTRTVYVLLKPVAGGAAAPMPSGYYNGAVISRCYDPANNLVSINSIPPGSNNPRCSFRFNFPAPYDSYFLVMAPIYSGTGWTTVQCTAGSGSCTHWIVSPTPAGSSGNAANTANLYVIGKGSKTSLVGAYELNYHVEMNVP
jgi:hypothetical protein